MLEVNNNFFMMNINKLQRIDIEKYHMYYPELNITFYKKNVYIIIKSNIISLKFFVLWMKLTEVFKKTSKKSNINYKKNFNRNYSRQDQFNEQGVKNITNYFKQKNIIDYEFRKFQKSLIKKNQKQIEKMLEHPTIIEITDLKGEKATVSIMNITTKDKYVIIDGNKVEVEYIGIINDKKQFLVKAILEVDLDTKDLKNGEILEKTSKFGFSRETNKELINAVKEIVKESKDLLIWDGKQGTSVKGFYKNKINSIENDLFDKFDN